MLVHICCSVDSHYFLQKIKKEYPNEELIGFFYDPNIHPYNEYYLRLLDVRRSCKILNIKLIEGEYDTANWLESIKGLENEPEKGARCSVCFDDRLEISAKKAKELRQKYFTTTLLVSPKKSHKKLAQQGKDIAADYDLEFLAPDYRAKSGTQEQNILAKKDKLYRQDYCGCLFALLKQREHQAKIADELFSPLSKQILPASIEERIALYELRCALEEKGQNYSIMQEHFLNYRLLRAYVTHKKETIPSYFLAYSTLKNTFTRGKIIWDKEIGYFEREGVCFITLKYFNKIAETDHKEIKALIASPPSFENELKIREKLTKNPYDLSAIIVIEKKIDTKIEIFIQSEIYDDFHQIIKLVD